MKVAVLGCGPAGLLAAHTVELCGHQPTIFSRKVRGIMPGTMFVHEAIPELCGKEPDAFIHYAKLGDKRGYAQKVYGDPDAPCSWDQFQEGMVEAWSMRAVYNKLWERFGDEVINLEITPLVLASVAHTYDKVISTVPAKLLCWGDHMFSEQRIWVARSHRDICEQIGDPCVIYNGDPQFAYYRTSLILGESATEFSDWTTSKAAGLSPGIKPLDTNCDCRSHILRAGRYGRWRKGVLVHDAFLDVMAMMEARAAA